MRLTSHTIIINITNLIIIIAILIVVILIVVVISRGQLGGHLAVRDEMDTSAALN